MNRLQKLSFFFAILITGTFTMLHSQNALAGFFVIGASGRYKHQNIDKDAWDKSQSITGSITYYLDEMSAFELSYTDGISKRFIGSTSGNNHITTIYYRMTGLDFIYTLGDRETEIRPYAKIGAVYIFEKRMVDQFEPFAPVIKEESPALVPSGGLGVRFLLTKSLSLKAGFDIWTSRPVDQTPLDYDYAGRVGLSWMF